MSRPRLYRVKEAGGKLLSDIETMPWGETLFHALEPCGGRICFTDADTLFTADQAQFWN